MEIAKKYGLIRRGEKDTESVRAMFLVGPSGKIRAISVYPKQVGRGGDEIRRLVSAAIKTTDENVYTPANWEPGDDVLLPDTLNLNDAIKLKENKNIEGEIYCPQWYYCFTKDTPTTQPPIQETTQQKHSDSLHIKQKNLFNPFIKL